MQPLSTITCDFSTPSKIVFGWGRRTEVGGLARNLGRRAFVVCGSKTLQSSGALAEVLQSLHAAGVEAVRLESVVREPLVEDVDRCVAALRDREAGSGDLVLGVGGGSAIDLAKAAAALAVQDAPGSVREYLEGVGTGRKIVNCPLPVLAMPATGGTGSEATKNAVISSHNPPFKKSLRSDQMVPRTVLVDPELCVTVPPRITAWTGMDAITQLIESLISKRCTPATEVLALNGLRLAIPRILAAYRDGSSRPAREAMSMAALLSGIALANSGLGMAHGVAAALGIHCRVPHGLACAVMLPAALAVNRSHPGVEGKISQLDLILNEPAAPDWRPSRSVAGDEGSNDAARPKGRSAGGVIARVESLLDELGIPRRLSEIGVRREQIPALVRDSRGNSMNGNPRDLSDAELTQILEDRL